MIDQKGIKWSIETNTLVTRYFSIAINKIESVILVRPWWSTLLAIIFLLLGCLMLVVTYDFYKDKSIYFFISLFFLIMSVTFFRYLRLSIFSQGRKYCISSFLSPKDRKDIIDLKKYFDNNLGKDNTKNFRGRL